jgi:hypothetical protein
MQANATKSPAARDEAKKFLTDILASGPVRRTRTRTLDPLIKSRHITLIDQASFRHLLGSFRD